MSTSSSGDNSRTALLSNTTTNAAAPTKVTVSKTYGANHAHIDTQEEQNKANRVIDGINNTKLKISVLFLNKLSKIIISTFSCITITSIAATIIGILGLFGSECMSPSAHPPTFTCTYQFYGCSSF